VGDHLALLDGDESSVDDLHPRARPVGDREEVDV
jgi:hypothetical protein